MNLKTLIYQNKMLKKKINELHLLLVGSTDDTVLQELFVQLELLQSKKVNINNVNNQVKVSVGGKEIPISMAVVLRDTIRAKIDVLTSMITDAQCKLDKINLMEQRDSFYAEYTVMSHVVDASDLTVKIGE